MLGDLFFNPKRLELAGSWQGTPRDWDTGRAKEAGFKTERRT